MLLEKESTHQLQTTQLQKLLKDTIKELQKTKQESNGGVVLSESVVGGVMFNGSLLTQSIAKENSQLRQS